MKLSTIPYAQNIVFPSDMHSISCNKMLSDTKLIVQKDNGHIIYTPIVQRIKKNIEKIVLDNAELHGFNEMLFPVLMNSNILNISGKTDEYYNEFYSLSDERNSLLISPTTEERLIDFVQSGGIQSYKNFPMRFAQISNVYRNLKRPEGLYKSKEISCVVLTAIDRDKSAYLETMEQFKIICEQSFKQIDISNFYIQDKFSGAVEFLYNTEMADRPLEKSIINNFGNNNEFKNKNLFGSLSMGYPFNQSENFNLSYVDNTGAIKKPVVSTYGIGTQRCIHSLFEKAKNGSINAFRNIIRPFDIDIVILDKNVDYNKIGSLIDGLKKLGLSYCIDDRNQGLKDKMQFSEFFSIPCRIVIGKKELEKEEYLIKPLESNNEFRLNLLNTMELIKKITSENIK